MFAKKILQSFVAMALSLPAFATHASVVTLDTSQSEFNTGVLNQGWWASGANASNQNSNHLTGSYNGSEYRSFYTFDVSQVEGVVSSATISINRGSQTGPVTLTFWDVTSAAANVNNNAGTNAAIFADLGSGISYGTFLVPSVSSSSGYMDFTLNSDFLDAINNASGYFTIGVSAASTGRYIFGATSGDVTTLRLTVDEQPAPSDVPEPASLAILLAGVASMSLARRRK